MQDDQPREASYGGETSKPTPTIVGLGASAGGLAAFRRFFASLPERTGLSFVVVMHLSPEHESHLADLLQPHCRLPVQQVTEDMALEPDRVYVIPPGRNLNSVDTHLRLSPLEESRRDRAPINHFFRTLANTHDGASIGVILTGTGSDGALGIRAIKACGGLTVVQDPNEAEFDGMPQSAISTRLVDLVLPLDQIAGEVMRYSSTRPRVDLSAGEKATDERQRHILNTLFSQLRARTGRDFSRYKRSTVMRRIRRRMQLLHVEELQDYADLLRNEPEEARALADEFLITVTHFFRDREVFEALKKDVIPTLFEGKGPEDQVRVWSVGCATGEEAYSLAMLLLEEAARHDNPPHVQVFASDLHEKSLRAGREGLYTGDIEIDVSPARVQRFFVKESGGFRIRKEVREVVVFTPHNLLGDPPFSKLDLIACRNLMIYLQRDVQQEVIEVFHYALNPNGYLLLGTSETSDRSELFQVENRPYCLYRKRNVPAPGLHLPALPLSRSRTRQRSEVVTSEPPERHRLPYGSLHQQMVERYVPPSILVSADHRIVHFSEHAGRFLVHPGGTPTSNLFKLVREELRLDLRTALVGAVKDGVAVRTRPIALRLEGETCSVVVHVRPPMERRDQGLTLVIFEEQAPLEASAAATAGRQDERLTPQTLKAELVLNEQRLQAVIEEYDTSQEEMKATNEELQAANEELRSTLEELETSKEELQSMNEELATVNQENRHKVEELGQLSNDLQNLLSATDIATIFLDRQFRILRFTPQVGALFNIRSADRGRPLSDLTHRLGYDQLIDDASQVLEKRVPIDREVCDSAGCWYLTRVRPYHSRNDHIGGVVITFIDITERKQHEAVLRESEARFRLLVDTSAQMVWSTDAEGNVNEVSPSWHAYTGQDYHEFKGSGWMEVVAPEDRERAQAGWRQAVATGQPLHNEFRVFHAESKTYRWAKVRADALRDSRGEILGWVGMNIDIHDYKTVEQSLKEINETLEARVEERTLQVRQLASKLTMAEQEERRRISQILHDNLQQLLYGLQMKTRMVVDQLEAAGQDTLKEAVAETQFWLQGAIDTTRQLTVDLSPPILKNEGLLDTLGWLKRQMHQLHGLEIELLSINSPEIPDENLRVLLFQVVREVLFNIKKHAGVNQARVELDQRDAHILIHVSDSGRGFDPSKLSEARGSGFGLANARERLRLVGGAMEIMAAPDAGTTIRISAPTVLEW